MKCLFKFSLVLLTLLLALALTPAQAADQSGSDRSYTGTVLTISGNIPNYGLASSRFDCFIGTSFEYADVDGQVTAIADKIRGKTSLADEMTLEQMAIDVASLPGRLFDVPKYVQTEAERVAAVVKSLQNENTLSFIAVTDPHVTTTSTHGITSALHAAQGAKIISELVPIDFTALLGDVVSGAKGETAEQHISNLMAFLCTTAVFDPMLRLSGNHDANIYSAEAYQTAADVYRYTGRFTRAVKPAAEVERNYFYFELPEKKTRVICLNTADLKDIPAISSSGNAGNKDGHYISAAQLSWLASVLDMTGKSGWRIIVLSHHPIHWYNSMTNVLDMLDAYVAGSSGSVTSDGTSVAYDFSGKNAAKLVAAIHGHTHNLIYGRAGEAEIVRMGTPNACYGRNNEYGNTGSDDFRAKYGETITYSKTANTARDTAFCVYTIDFAAETVHATCYGAGYDRIMSYAGVPYYSVTTTLPPSISISNTTVYIKEGDSYTANLILDDGYSLASVTVTMGGVDITNSAYADGIINISSVTGDISIAARVNGYTNIISNIGYSNGYRLSTSTGKLKSQSGYVTTGMIDLGRVANGDVIRTKGMDFNAENWRYSAYVYYADDSGTFMSSGYLNSGDTSARSIVFDEDGNLTLTLKQASGVRYLKICGYGSGSNLIVTINEEIGENDPGSEPDTPDGANLVPIAIDTR